MTWWERWTFNTLHVVVAVTGVTYFVMKYVLPADDPFAVINHPWQPPVLSMHVVAAPLFVLIFGMVLRSHILTKILSNSRPGRRSGWISLVSFSAMGLSGYLLQIAGTPWLLQTMLVTHVGTSLVFVVGYGAHLLRPLSVPALTEEPGLPKAARLL